MHRARSVSTGRWPTCPSSRGPSAAEREIRWYAPTRSGCRSGRRPAKLGTMPNPYESLAGVPNACQPLPGVVTGGQPAAADLQRLSEAGGGIVLDLRDPMEPRPFDEPALARRLGLEYVNVAVGPGDLTDETLERILGVLRGAGDRTVIVHCASGNRVGGALL